MKYYVLCPIVEENISRIGRRKMKREFISVIFLLEKLLLPYATKIVFDEHWLYQLSLSNLNFKVLSILPIGLSLPASEKSFPSNS